ncbi:condensin-2 complex subunit H2-like [Latimeria chalumnae]|uniref:condensin-2 complex subunit H2-like n=1 Tax=Latimeria chalumnae TaxID=7897 RepID=UPI00313C364A
MCSVMCLSFSLQVEYLYTLVYQALDLICNKKRNQQPASLGEDGVDKDATSLNRRENREEEFLSLDDFMDSSRANLDLRQDWTRNVSSGSAGLHSLPDGTSPLLQLPFLH